MGKKFVSLFTLVAFISFILSCYSTKISIVRNISDFKGKNVKILGVRNTSGEYIEFNENRPGKIRNGTIEAELKRNIKIDIANVKSINDYKGKLRGVYEIVTKDGEKYIVNRYKKFEDRIIIEGLTHYSIPLNEVKMALVQIKKLNPVSSLIIIVPLVVLVILSIVESQEPPPPPSGESCPFIYSFNGEQYIFDGEPYGLSICEGLKRTEWCGLQNLKEVNGQYRILVINELNEIQYIDELKLLVVNHPKGVKVAPDILGGIHTISKPILPSRAYDKKGNDLIHYVSKNDWKFWQSRNEEKNPDRKNDLREELTFEFPKPKNVKKAKLIFNGRNTFLGSNSIKRYLSLHGNKVLELYNYMNNLGPLNFIMPTVHGREELYQLRIRIETKNDWKFKGIIHGGGPYISAEKIYPLDISDITGNKLKIKLTPPAGFWTIDYIAVDYSEDLPIEVTEVEAIEAIDHNGQDMREVLTKNDKNYLIMPNIADRSELVFESPPHLDGMDRSVILKANGYYDIHLESSGEPQTELLERFQAEPGFVVQYMFKEYRKWEKNYLRKIGIE